jgi:hypothetical protein
MILLLFIKRSNILASSFIWKILVL